MSEAIDRVEGPAAKPKPRAREPQTEMTECLRIDETLWQRYRDVVDNVPIVLFALDASGLITLSEGKGLALIGLKPGQLVGQSIFDMYTEAPDLQANARLALGGESVTFVTKVDEQIFEVHFIPFFNRQDEVAGVHGVAYSITDRKQYEKEL